MKYFALRFMRKIGFVPFSYLQAVEAAAEERVSRLNSFMKFMGSKANDGKISAINDNSYFQHEKFEGDVFVLGDRNEFIHVQVTGNMHFSPEAKMNSVLCPVFAGGN
jgi:hypothetical protein